ncbi:MAG: murein transglycosylase A [bacterium]|jgi:membrane-bound lytic murein transglycosylase A|nr:murein transglycosylase A [Betaproteobacteria bacterium]
MTERRRPAAAALAAALILVAAGCATRPDGAPSVPSVPSVAPDVGQPAGTPATTPTPPQPPAPAVKPGAPFSPLRHEAAAWKALPGWYSDRIDEAWPALRESCRALATRRAAAPWLEACRAAEAMPAADTRDPARVRAFFERHFVPWRLIAVDADGTENDRGLITGYYEPLLRGSRSRDARYRYPLYGVPDDLVTVDLAALYPQLKGQRIRGRLEGRRLLPYFSRGEIDRGVASLKGRELLWVDDRLDAFFLEIQGSGRVQLPDGSVVRIGYADQNGHPYRAIGRVLVERGELTLEEASMQGIRNWALANPDKVTPLLHSNPSRVFFRELPPLAASAAAASTASGAPGAVGPPGSLGVPLTPMRSIAIDPRSVMLGAPVWLATVDPLDGKPIERLTFAQDTGGAIIGAIRADLFWGFGNAAGESAGRMREFGAMWMLLPRGVKPGRP